MSEKSQRTSASLRDKMLSRYGTEHHHKHNKNHLQYRQHFRSHPCELNNTEENITELSHSTGLIRQFKLRKMRKRLDKGRYH